ncbi:hypothetical protein COV81_04145 [Candidatus Peregrinibacteria bacterium CG11_big_fil_rev_8_21_14_0_20_41_10]|nr:MAG: hypothetical protein COV81_04145 [Candidatus Peregrinibacteria bacterium CG11_big_fil_rev_8_21_14_0_20_41_10]PIZ77679.1 MAG: hypothetical protein COY06_00355 [Candidatus Peregrinibacteria bacterium CG_4_10_14_0_2_um_filter_41_8]
MFVEEDMSLDRILTVEEEKVVGQIVGEIVDALGNYFVCIFLKGIWGRLLKQFKSNELVLEKQNVAKVSQDVRLLMKKSLKDDESADPCLVVAHAIYDRMKSGTFQTLAGGYVNNYEKMLSEANVNEMKVIEAVVDRVWPILVKKLG